MLVLVGWSCAANADTPTGVAQQLARFIFDGCDYFEAHSLQPHRPDPPHRMLAAHFGHVVKTQERGIALEYVLKVQKFAGWDISYWERGVDMKLPPTVAITMGDLQRLLGPEQLPDVDLAVSNTAIGAKVDLADRVFEPPGHGVCRVTVRTEADPKKGPERRVFSLRFAD